MKNGYAYSLNGYGCTSQQLAGDDQPPIINWNTEPDTSADGREVKWTSNDWISWHAKIAIKYGVARANEVTQQWWDRLPWYDYRKYTWPLDCTFYNYFRKAGGGWASLLPSIICTIDEGGGQIVDSAGNIITNVASGAESLSEGVSSTAKTLKWLVPTVLVVGVGGLAWYGYNQYIKSKKKPALAGFLTDKKLHGKSLPASQVLTLMDKDYEYSDALKMVVREQTKGMSANKSKQFKRKLEKELNKYI